VLQLILKFLQNFQSSFKKGKKFPISILNQKKTASNNLISNDQTDQQLISYLNKKKRVSWQQLKLLPKFMTPKETARAQKLLIIGASAIILLIGNFYFSHIILEPKNGGSYTEGLVGSPQYINPLLAPYNDVDADLSALIFNGLFKTNPDGLAIKDLAENFTVSDDKKTYTITLRKNIVWHDNEPLTADDVIFTFNAIQDPAWQSPLKNSLTNVTSNKIDDYTVAFVLKDPLPNFINNLTFGILPEHLWQTIAPQNYLVTELNKKPIGSGPFRFKSITKEKNGAIKNIVLERNVAYFTAASYLDEITFKFYPDWESAVSALANKNLEGLNFLPEEWQDKAKENKDLNFYSLSVPQYVAIFFNTRQNEFLKDVKVRQALAYAIDREKIIHEALRDKGGIINGPILPGDLGYKTDGVKYDYTPEQAGKLLADDGFKLNNDGQLVKNNQQLTITLTTVENQEYNRTAEIIKNNWEALGIKTEINIVPKEKIRSDIIEPRSYQALLFSQVVRNDLFAFWHSSATENPGGNLAIWSNNEVDDLLEALRTLENPEEITAKKIRLQEILADQVPAIFLYNPIHLYPVNKKIQGLTTRRIILPADRFAHVADWYIKTQRHFYWSLPEEQ